MIKKKVGEFIKTVSDTLHLFERRAKWRDYACAAFIACVIFISLFAGEKMVAFANFVILSCYIGALASLQAFEDQAQVASSLLILSKDLTKALKKIKDNQLQVLSPAAYADEALHESWDKYSKSSCSCT